MKLTIVLILLFLPLQSRASSTTFDAADTKIAVTTVAALNTTQVSVCYWRYPTGDGEGGTNGAPVDKRSGGTNGYGIYIGTPHEQFEAAWPTGARRFRVTTALPLNAWTHVCWRYDGASTTNNPSICANGVTVAVTQATATNTGTWVNTFNLTIGNSPEQTQTWQGRLAEMAFYNRILTDNECKAVMTRGPKSLPNGLVAYYPLGYFLGLNLTTNSLAGTETLGAGSHNGDGPPLSYIPGGVLQ